VLLVSSAVLWDIDHTLVDTGGLGRELYQTAFEQVARVLFRRPASISGSTEFRIFSETLALHGVPPSEELSAAYAEVLASLHVERTAELQARGQALPGGRDVLLALQAKGFVQTVVTGNLRAVAVTKLKAFGLDSLLELEIGAYAEDGEDREEIVRVAMARVSAYSYVLIGDTSSDVAAAKANGVPVIGVATGKSSVEELRNAGADVALADLADVDAVVAAVVGLATA